MFQNKSHETVTEAQFETTPLLKKDNDTNIRFLITNEDGLDHWATASGRSLYTRSLN